MTITANGKPVEISGELSVTKLLEETKVEMPEYVTVQLNGEILKLNGEILKRADFDITIVKDSAVVGLAFIRLGHGCVIPTPHSGTFCPPWSLLRKALIRAGKTP